MDFGDGEWVKASIWRKWGIVLVGERKYEWTDGKHYRSSRRIEELVQKVMFGKSRLPVQTGSIVTTSEVK